MSEVIKQLRKCDNLSLLVISDDSKFNNEIEELFVDVENLQLVNTINEALKLCKTTDFNVVILDTRDDSFKKFFEKLDGMGRNPLKIIVCNPNSSGDVIDAINFNVYTVLAKPFNVVNLKLSILMSLNQGSRSDKIKLGQGFYLDIYRDRIYSKSGKVVEMTKLELGLLKLIIDNWGQLVEYDEIQKKVWKGKNMSIFTMRNVVNKIRTKTYYDVFRNDSSKGYIIG